MFRREKNGRGGRLFRKESFSAQRGKILKQPVPLPLQNGFFVDFTDLFPGEERIVEEQNSGFVVIKRLPALM